MSEKFDSLYNELKSLGVISHHGNRVMTYSAGHGQVRYWKLDELEDGRLELSDDGLSFVFNNAVINKNDNGAPISLVADNTMVFKFPSQKKLAEIHNTSYPEEFVVEMEEVLSNKQEDWLSSHYNDKLKVFTDAIKRNVSQIKKSASVEEIRKACVDVANWACFCYYLGKGGDEA